MPTDGWIPKPQQKLTQTMLGAEFVDLGIRSRSHQVTECLVLPIGHPDRRQIATPQQTRKLEGIPSIGLDLVAWPNWDERRRNNDALDAHFRQLPMQRIARRPRLVGHP